MYDSFDHENRRDQNLFGFMSIFVFAQAIGLICVILTGYWLNSWDGFGWADKKTVFNYHPLFMVIGLVFLYGDAILLYRVCRMYRKWPVKVAHACVNLLCLVFAIFGVSAVFSSHNRLMIPNLYSLHSWVGFMTFFTFICQWFISFCTFLYPGASETLRARFLPIHKYMGLFLFFGSLISCISGINEKNFFSEDKYSELKSRELIGNVAGLFIVIYGALVFYLAHNDEFRRIELSPSQEPIIGEQRISRSRQAH